MYLDINEIDLLCVALGVFAYAAGATIWAFRALPPRRFDTDPVIISA